MMGRLRMASDVNLSFVEVMVGLSMSQAKPM